MTKKKKEQNKFDVGDLIIKCHQCGETQLVESLVRDGRAIYLFTTHDSSLKLTCPKCKITMEMTIVPTEFEDETEEELLKEGEQKDEELSEKSSSEETV